MCAANPIEPTLQNTLILHLNKAIGNQTFETKDILDDFHAPYIQGPRLQTIYKGACEMKYLKDKLGFSLQT